METEDMLREHIADLQDEVEEHKDRIRELERENNELKIRVSDAKHTFDHLADMASDMLRSLS